MKIEIISSQSKLPIREGWIRLTEKDFNHYESFFAKHPDIKPESVDEIYTMGVLDASPNVAIIIRHIDFMLKNGGKFIVDMLFPFIPWYGWFNKYYAIKYFISQSFNSPLILTSKEISDIAHYEYQKNGNCLPYEDSIESWSWGICSNGQKNEQVCEIISQINNLNIPNCEIIVCGPKPADTIPDNVVILDDADIYTEGDIRVPIGKKKNMIAEHATFNNLVILHDRFTIPEAWYTKMKSWGNYYDMLAFPVLAKEEPSLHLCDWQNADYYHPISPINQNHFPAYSEYNEFVFINGGIFVCKKHIYQNIKISPKLNWEEMEDVDFSRRMMLNGYVLFFDINNCVYSTTHRMGTIGEPIFFPKKRTVKQIILQKREFYNQIHKTRKSYECFLQAKIFKFDIFEMKWIVYRILYALSKRTPIKDIIH